MLTINQINSAIMQQDWTNDQLNRMIAAVKYARAQLGLQHLGRLAVERDAAAPTCGSSIVQDNMSQVRFLSARSRT